MCTVRNIVWLGLLAAPTPALAEGALGPATCRTPRLELISDQFVTQADGCASRATLPLVPTPASLRATFLLWCPTPGLPPNPAPEELARIPVTATVSRDETAPASSWDIWLAADAETRPEYVDWNRISSCEGVTSSGSGPLPGPDLACRRGTPRVASTGVWAGRVVGALPILFAVDLTQLVSSDGAYWLRFGVGEARALRNPGVPLNGLRFVACTLGTDAERTRIHSARARRCLVAGDSASALEEIDLAWLPAQRSGLDLAPLTALRAKILRAKSDAGR